MRLLATLSVLFLAMSLSPLVEASSFYVATTGSDSNSGTTEKSPFLDVATALAAASPGDVIYVAEGTYTGSQNIGLDLNSVNLQGASVETIFKGDSSYIFGLHGSASLSTLTISASVNSTGVEIYDSNIYVGDVTFTQLHSAIVLAPAAVDVTVSGCTIAATVSQGIVASTNSSYSWHSIDISNSAFEAKETAVYVYTTSGVVNNFQSLSFTNCSFTTAKTDIQFGIGTGAERVSFTRCNFTDITSSGKGGGVAVSAHNDITVTDCIFESCTSAGSDAGGGCLAVFEVDTTFRSLLTVSGSYFSGCSSFDNGGAIETSDVGVSISNSVFVNNTAVGAGAAVSCQTKRNAAASYTIDGSVFSYNEGMSKGGALSIKNAGERCSVTNSEFGYNEGKYGAGLYYSSKMPLSVSGCTFVGNYAHQSGGGFYSSSTAPASLQDLLFVNNTAGIDGGAIQFASGATGRNVTATGNRADFNGGAFGLESSSVTLTDSLLVSNLALSGGVAWLDIEANLNLTNSLVVDNRASYGGGIYVNDGSIGTLHSVLMAANTAGQKGGAIYCNVGGMRLTHMAFFNNTSPVGASYFCSSGCDIFSHNVYYPPGTTRNCASHSTVAADLDFGITMDRYHALKVDTEEEAMAYYQSFFSPRLGYQT